MVVVRCQREFQPNNKDPGYLPYHHIIFIFVFYLPKAWLMIIYFLFFVFFVFLKLNLRLFILVVDLVPSLVFTLTLPVFLYFEHLFLFPLVMILILQ